MCVGCGKVEVGSQTIQRLLVEANYLADIRLKNRLFQEKTKFFLEFSRKHLYWTVQN